MKKILFFTCEPGGAEVLIPVIQEMNEDNAFEVIVLSYGLAMDRFNKRNILFETINPIQKDDFSIFLTYQPDYIITSATSLPQKDMSEKFIWHNAKQSDIPTMAFLDQWQNYDIRFSGTSSNEYMLYQPDYINCINDIGKQEMIELGFDSNKLLELGQPYLSQLKNTVLVDKEKIFEQLNLDKDKETVLFVSEAIYENYGNARGYTQYKTLEYLLDNKEFINNKQIIIKLHPKDDITKFDKYKDIILIQNEYTSYEMISVSDFIMGMTSIMLIEAYILEKKVLSIQLNSMKDLLLLSKYSFIDKITSIDKKIKEKNFTNKGNFLYTFDYEKLKGYIIK